MKRKGKEENVELAELLRQIDDSDSERESRSDATLPSLTASQKNELLEAQAALSYLNRVRDLCEQESVSLVRDSTFDEPRASAVADEELDTLSLDSSATCRTIGRFEIIRELGRGGFAHVFLARDPSLNRNVALKIPKPEALASEDSRARFQREAKAAAILSHPAIVPVFESSTVGPLTYIAYGYCPGVTLSDWMRQESGALDQQQVARTIARLADAVHHAHQRGVIHRDLKPSNVLIEIQDSVDSVHDLSEHVRISDFGLAKFESGEDQTLTQEGGLVGTPAYMSPEQATGDHEIGETADVFSLGVILYEMLTGVVPHKKETYLKTLRAIESEAPAAPRQRNPKVSRDLEAICLKCLEKNKSERYSSAFDLAEDLRNLLELRPVSARRHTLWKRLDNWTRRNRILVRATMAVLLIATLSLAFTLFFVNRARNDTLEALAKANQETYRAEMNLEKADAVVETFLEITSDQLYDLPGATAIRDKMVREAFAYYEDFLEQAESNRDTRLADLARVRTKLGQLSILSGEIGRAIPLIQQSQDDYHQLLKKEANNTWQLALVQTHSLLGFCQHQSGDADAALRSYQKTIELVEAQRKKGNVSSEANSLMVEAIAGKTRIYFDLHQLEAAQRENQKSKQILHTLEAYQKSRARQFALVRCRLMQVILSRAAGDFKQTETLLASVETTIDRLYELFPASRSLRTIHVEFYQLKMENHFDHGRFADVIRLGKLSMRLLEELEKQNPTIGLYQGKAVEVLALLANSATQLRDDPSATNWMDSATKRMERFESKSGSNAVTRDNASQFGRLCNDRGLILFNQKQHDLAIKEFEKAIRFTRRAIEHEPYRVVLQSNLSNHYFGLAESQRRLKKYELALDAISKAESIRGDLVKQSIASPSDRVRLALIRSSKGVVLRMLGKSTEAIPIHQQLVADIEKLPSQGWEGLDAKMELERQMVYWMVSAMKADDPNAFLNAIQKVEKHRGDDLDRLQRMVQPVLRGVPKCSAEMKQVVEPFLDKIRKRIVAERSK